MKIINITDGNFEDEAVVTHKAVMIELWAPTYPPSKYVKPVVEAVAEEYDEVIKVGRLDVSKQHNLREMLEVDVLPQVLLLTGGIIDKKIVGHIPTKEEIIETFELEKHRKKAEESWLKKK